MGGSPLDSWLCAAVLLHRLPFSRCFPDYWVFLVHLRFKILIPIVETYGSSAAG